MDYTNQFISYLDSELPVEREAELFSVMSADDSVRLEFRNIYSLFNNIKNNVKYYAPSVHLTNSIFYELAINPNVTEPVREKSLIGKKNDNLLSGVIGSLITIALLLPLFILFVKNSENHSYSKFQANSELNSINSSNQNIADKIIASDKNQVSISIVKSKATKQVESYNINPMVTNVKDKQSNISSNDVLHDISFSDLSYNMGDGIQRESIIQTQQLPIENERFFQNVKSEFTANVRYEFRYNIFSNFVDANPNTENSAILKNCTIGALYQLSPVLSLGLELNQEEFSIAEKQNIYEKNTISRNFSSYEAVARFYFTPISSFDPYVQINLGFNKIGLIGRAEIGTRINIDYNFGLITGIKLNGLFYMAGSELNLTSKAAFSCGFTYNL